ncbi:MAG TPA: YceI family protein, partial [Prolixibacteraceae bacterium]|nr:YceI family protein [Prolixibacteraceae bacterium]
ELENGKATVTGELTIKGITHPVEFEGTKTGNVFEATITIDRTKYNVRYGSGKFFENLGDNMIHDDFTLDVTLVTTKE